MNGASLIHCPACYSTRQAGPLEAYDAWKLYECLECGVQHFWPARNPGAKYYQTNEMYRNRDLVVVDWLGWYHRAALDLIPIRRGRLLDVGCGTGTFVAAARRLGFDATGIDFAATAIEAGKRRLGVDTLYAMSIDEYRNAHPDERFDVVTAFEILEHMDDARAFTAALVEMVRPGGLLVISVPNRERFPRLLNEGDLPPHHFTRWDRRALERHLATQGLQPVRTVVCPTTVTLKALLIHYLRFGFVTRLLRRAEAEAQEQPADAQRDVLRAQRLTRLKDRAMDMAAAALAPVAAPLVRGPMMVTLARRGRASEDAS